MGLLFPPRCLVCDRVLSVKEDRICPECRKKLIFVSEPVCKKCGKPILIDTKEYCGDCAAHAHAYIQAKALLVYNEEAKRAMYRLKYKNRRDYADVFIEEAEKRYGKWIKMCGICSLVPIPMFEKKKKARGYDQAELLAKALAKRTGIRADLSLLERRKQTIPQKELDRNARQKNLKGAFVVTRKEHLPEAVLLIDDIYTTGSTVDAAAHALIKAGVRKIYVLCICIGQDY